MYEIWKDTETGYTDLVEKFNSFFEAAEWINKYQRYYEGWHLRIVEKKNEN